MDAAALDRVGRLRPVALHPFEISPPRAILELVDHARRQIGLVRAQRRGPQGKLGLVVHRGRCDLLLGGTERGAQPVARRDESLLPNSD